MGYCLCYVHQMKGSCKIDISIGFQVSDTVRMIQLFLRALIPNIYSMKYLCLNWTWKNCMLNIHRRYKLSVSLCLIRFCSPIYVYPSYIPFIILLSLCHVSQKMRAKMGRMWPVIFLHGMNRDSSIMQSCFYQDFRRYSWWFGGWIWYFTRCLCTA